jgi:hypothetical protein
VNQHLLKEFVTTCGTCAVEKDTSEESEEKNRLIILQKLKNRLRPDSVNPRSRNHQNLTVPQLFKIFFFISLTPKIPCCFHKSPRLFPILSQFNLMHITIPYFSIQCCLPTCICFVKLQGRNIVCRAFRYERCV